MNDILWQHEITGEIAIWLMNGATVSTFGSLGAVSDPNWQIVN
jgi:hypothetical protein